jgi:hypothetical protein
MKIWVQKGLRLVALVGKRVLVGKNELEGVCGQLGRI